MFNTGHILELLVAVITFWGIMWNFRREDRKERQQMRMRGEEERQKQHQENQDKMDTLLREHEERPPHAHIESRGPLTAEGIRYRRLKGGD